MQIFKYFLTFLFSFIFILLLEYLWLGLAIQDFMIEQFQNLITVQNGSIDVNIFYGLIVWVFIVVGCLVFATFRWSSGLEVFGLGVLFGLIVYVVYDLTNLAYLDNYPWKFALIDMARGSLLCWLVSSFGYWVYYTFLTYL